MTQLRQTVPSYTAAQVASLADEDKFFHARTVYRLNVSEGKKWRSELARLTAERDAYLAAGGDPTALDTRWESSLVAFIAKVDAATERAKVAYEAAAAAVGLAAV